MRVYRRFNTQMFTYPEDMKLILSYLNKHGKVLVNEITVEDLYYKFSDERYSAGWMSVNDKLLEEFEDWLNNYEY